MQRRATTRKQPVIQVDEAPEPDMATEDVYAVDAVDAVPAETEQATDAERLPLQATPSRRRLVTASAKHLPKICAMVYAIVSTGPRQKIDILPLHEVPLLRRKLHLQDPSLEAAKVLAEFPAERDRVRQLTLPELRDEHQRLLARYRFDKPGGRDGEEVNLVAEFYGSGMTSLRDTMRRLEAGWRQISGDLQEDETVSDDQLEELVTLSDPDFSMTQMGEASGYEEFEPRGSGSVVASDGGVSLRAK